MENPAWRASYLASRVRDTVEHEAPAVRSRGFVTEFDGMLIRIEVADAAIDRRPDDEVARSEGRER